MPALAAARYNPDLKTKHRQLITANALLKAGRNLSLDHHGHSDVATVGT